MADASLALISRKQAKALGLKFYFTGKPCKHGHIAHRYTTFTACLICHTKYDAEYQRAYRQTHRDKRLTSQRAWHEANPDNKREWRKSNLERSRSIVRTQRARKRGAEGKHTERDVRDLFVKQDGKCANLACRVSIKNGYHVDHVMPLILGGSNGPENLQLLCPKCNQRKNAKHPQEWAREQGMLFA